MFKGVVSLLGKQGLILGIISVLLVILHLSLNRTLFADFHSEALHDYTLSIYFETDGTDISVETFLPQTDDRQEVIRERVVSGRLKFDDSTSEAGRKGQWQGSNSTELRYNALISSKKTTYFLDPSLKVSNNYPAWLQEYLNDEEGIQYTHPEIETAWQQIKPENMLLLVPVLRAIYDFTYTEIEGAPYKGFTSALTALRLRQASCNGKGRLFVAMARRNGIPARLIGGVILNEGSKKTSHQWVEVYVQDRWVPFDPTNGHFATLPANYLQLYTGDEPLFTHTRNINFDYRFSVATSQLSSALFRFEEGDIPFSFNAAELLALTGLNEKTTGVFLMFPFATLIIVFLRNIIGIKTFGIFMPMLIAAACVHTGLLLGLVTFVGIVLFAFVGEVWLNNYNLLKIPRLAAVITLCTALFLIILWSLGDRNTFEFGVLALFPVIIISFLAERIHQMAAEKDWKGLIASAAGALASTSLCYLAFASVTLQGLFAIMPELLLLVLALQVSMGRWSGMRLMEYLRFKEILHDGNVLGINRRNREFVSTLNDVQLLDLAADKLRSKEILKTYGVPVASNLATCRGYKDLDPFISRACTLEAFALKPNKGSQGNGILVITRREGRIFYTAGGRKVTEEMLAQHTSEILSGSYSQSGDEDSAYIEPLLMQCDALNALAELGLSDIRLILHNKSPVSAMLRIPTSKSSGKANLHQGAVGVAIDLQSGVTKRASQHGKEVENHPDTGANLLGFKVPHWGEILEIAHASSDAIPLGYIGVDLCIDKKLGPLVLEVNGRPGIEIQNVQRKGLLGDLAQTIPAS